MSGVTSPLGYEHRRVLGRVVVTGSGDQTLVVVRPNIRLAVGLLLLSILSAFIGWAPNYAMRSVRNTPMWVFLAMILGSISAVVLFANAIGLASRTQRVQVTAKRLEINGRGNHMAFLREDIVAVEARVAQHLWGIRVGSLNASHRAGGELCILLASRSEVSFAADVLQTALNLAPDPLNTKRFGTISGRYVSAYVAACGAIARLRRFPMPLEAVVVWVCCGIVGAGLVACIAADPSAFAWCMAVLSAGSLGLVIWSLLNHFAASLSGGIWDDDAVFSERRFMRPLARLEYPAAEVIDVGLLPTSKSGRSRLCIMLRSGEQVMSERTWPSAKLEAFVNTVNEARRRYPKYSTPPSTANDTVQC